MAVSKLFRTAFRVVSGGFGLFSTNTKDVMGSAFFDEADATPPVETGTTVTYSITNTLDDVADYTSVGGGVLDAVATGGYGVGYVLPGGLRFRGVAVPQGATITSATLTVKKDTANTSGTTWGVLHGVAADNAPLWSTTRPALATKTSQYLPVVDGLTQTYAVKDIVQAIVSRSGWASGNALAFVGDDPLASATGVMVWTDFSASPTDCAKLSVTYTLETPPAPTRQAVRSFGWL